MCINPFKTPKVKQAEAPAAPDTAKTSERAQDELRRRLAARGGTSATFLTSPLGAANFGSNVRRATLLGSAGAA